MSAPVIQPLAPGREQGSVGAPRGEGATRSTRKISLVGLLLTASLAACSSDKGIGIDPIATPTSSAATASPTPIGEQQALLSQYRLFWASLTPVSKMPASQRRAALEDYTSDPELKSLVAGMAAIESKGQVYYGAAVPRPSVPPVDPEQTVVLVDDCQAANHAGLANRANLRHLTVGVARNHVVVTLKRRVGEAWKVTFVSYTKTPC
jgi:hypothetical protein